MVANTDHAINTRFRFNLTGNRELTLRVQKVPATPITLPGTNMFPHMGKADFNIPSNKFTYDPLVIDFIVSEDYHEYFQVLDWMKSCLSDDEFRNNEERGELELLDSQYQPVGRITYKDIWPTEIGEMTYETDEDAVYLKCTVTCFFTDIDWERITE